jgi:ubiquinone/menaquinone biosynthesis C-methylase UbiE
VRIDPTAASGFTAGAAAYERGRPSYPDDAIELLVDELWLAPGRRVLDLAAGTGKMTTLLAAAGADVVAVEPVAAMRERLAAQLSDVEVLAGTAEAIPLDDQAVDAVVVAQAFHWFDAPRALREIARVLRPGGGLALVWNSRDTGTPWVARLTELIQWNQGQIPTYDAGDEGWIEVIGRAGCFGPVQLREARYEQVVDEDTLIDRVASTSYIATMDQHERGKLLQQVRELVAGFPPTFVLPYRTFVYWCRLASNEPS